MYRFLIVIEKAKGNYSAYSPDLPGCVATGASREKTEQNMYQAIEFHIKGRREDGLPVPESTSFQSTWLCNSGRFISEGHLIISC